MKEGDIACQTFSGIRSLLLVVMDLAKKKKWQLATVDTAFLPEQKGWSVLLTCYI